MSNDPLGELVSALIRWPFQLVHDLWRMLRFVMRMFGLVSRQPLGPYEKNRRRAVAAAFSLVLCLYLLRTGAWLLNQLPPWVPTTLIVVAILSALYLLAGLYGTRNGPRDLIGAISGLSTAVGCAGLLWWEWYVPAEYGPTADDVNRLLPGLYIAVTVAAILRAVICLRLFGGAQRIIAQVMRQRAMSRRPALMGSFWEQTRAAFEDGRSGRPWP